MFHCVHQRCQIIIGQHHVCRLPCHIGAAFAHCHADIGFLDRRCIVDTIAGHGNDLATPLVSPNQPQLVCRIDTGKDGILVNALVQLGISQGIQFGSGHGFFSAEQSCLSGNGGGSVFVVAGNHDGADIRLGTGADCRACGLSGRIQHAGKPQKDAGTAFLFGERQHPQGFV